MLCLISVLHSMMLLLDIRCYFLSVRREKESELLMDVLCVFFLLSSLHRMSFVSVVFDFNASLNAVAPVSPMLLPV